MVHIRKKLKSKWCWNNCTSTRAHTEINTDLELRTFTKWSQSGSCCCFQSPSCVLLFATPWTAAGQASLSLTISWSLPKFMFIALVMPSSQHIFWRPLILLPSIFPIIRGFSSELSVHIRWPKYWSFNFSICRSSEHSGLISLKSDWFDLLAVQGTLRSPLQHHSLMASILWHSAFFIVQLSQPYMATEKTISFTIQTFVHRMMSLLFHIL